MKKLAVMLVAGLVAQLSFGTAATAPVNTPARSGMKSSYGVYTNTIIYAGSIVCLNSSGYAVAGADASGNVVIGRACKTVDNRVNATGAGDSGALTIEVERGVFGWKQSGTAISDTTVGSFAYVLDSQTVTNASAGNAIIAGIIVDYSDGYVWVDTFSVPRTAGSFTTLAASGATTLSDTLDVTGNTTVGGTLVGSSTISATGYKIGAVSGMSRTVTNAGTGYTNLWIFTGGILTNYIATGSMP